MMAKDLEVSYMGGWIQRRWGVSWRHPRITSQRPPSRVPIRLGPSGLVELIAGSELCWATRAARGHARATRATLNRICRLPHLDTCAHRPPTGHPGASNWLLAQKPNPKRRDALFILCKLHSSLPINCIALHSENVCGLSGFNACHQLLRPNPPHICAPSRLVACIRSGGILASGARRAATTRLRLPKG